MAGKWNTVSLEHSVHVVPQSDLIEHDLNFDCSCRPTLEWHERILISHNSIREWNE